MYICIQSNQGWTGQGFFPAGQGSNLWGRGKQGSKSSGRGGAGQGSNPPGRGGADAGQNLGISADLDLLLKEGKR